MGNGHSNQKPKREIKIFNSHHNNQIKKFDKEALELNIVLKIIDQMKTCICKIEKDNNNSGTGFFCIIPCPNISNQITALITSYKVLGKKDLTQEKVIKLIFYDKSYKIIKINKHRKIYTSNELKDNITIIEIKTSDNININNNDILKIDRGIYNEQYLKFIYNNKAIYSIFFCKNNQVKYDVNIITNIEPNFHKIFHLCAIEEGASGAPILNLENYEVMGINTGNNLGTFIKEPINEFIQLFKAKNKSRNNEINLTLEIKTNEIDKIIYFLDNTDFKDFETNKYHYHDNLKELNKSNTKLYINTKEFPFTKCFRPKRKGIYIIRLIFNIQLTDCSYMFYWCYNIINIDLSFFDSSKVTNMSNMFSFCLHLNNLDLKDFDTSNVTDMSNMFNFCNHLTDISLLSFNTEKVINMSRMFSDCSELKTINFETFNTKNVKSMSHMFFSCKNLNHIDLSNFDTGNVIIMSNMFYFCKSIITLDLTSFNTHKVFDMSKMFYLCNNLVNLYLSSFNTRNVINMSHMFADCKSLVTLDLSSFDTRNVIDMSHFLSGCDLLNINLSHFNTINVSNMSFMFYFCKNLKEIDVSSFNTKNVTNMSYMFSDCRFLKYIDLSSFDVTNVKKMNFMFEGCAKTLKIKVNGKSIVKFKNENEKCTFYI